jgi:hypothetical protein
MDTGPGAFFNRSHFVQGAQFLGMVFCMLGVIFVGLDRRGMGSVRPVTITWLGLGVTLSLLAALSSRRIYQGITPVLTGSAVGLLFLATTWLLARTGG